MANPRMNLAILAALAALPPGSAGPSVQRDGVPMSDEDRERQDAERLARAPRRVRRAEERRKRKADKRRAIQASPNGETA